MAGWNHWNFGTTVTAAQGDWYAVELAIAGTGTYTMAGMTHPAVAHPTAIPAGLAAGRTTGGVLTGVTHNVTNSAGKDLRILAVGSTDVIYTSTLPSQAGATSTTVILDSGASAVNQAYQWDVISAVAGTGQGSEIITNYVGATRTATISAAWAVQPIAGDTLEITSTARVQVVSYFAGQDPGTLTWSTLLTGSFTTGQAGYIIGNLADATTLISDLWATVLPAGYTTGQAGNIVGNLADVPTVVAAVWSEPVPASYPSGSAGWYQGRVIAGLGF